MAPQKSEPIHILLAEDDPDDRQFFQEALAEAQISSTLTSVEDGLQLMKYLEEPDGQRPDIIFLDINMPYKDGKECLKEIRRNQKFKDVPVVMFSTSSYKTDIEETFANGANMYVSKPVFFEDVVNILKQIFSLNWQKELLIRDRKRFLMLAMIT